MSASSTNLPGDATAEQRNRIDFGPIHSTRFERRSSLVDRQVTRRKEITMRVPNRLLMIVLATGAAAALAVGCSNSPAGTTSAPVGPATAAAEDIGGQEEFGPYEPVSNWPQPLADAADGVKHDGWTWGSVGAVYAETPDRIWIAQRGELPLPAGAKPWTPYAMLSPSKGNATGNGDGLSATCEPTEKRGWERRYHHAIFV